MPGLGRIIPQVPLPFAKLRLEITPIENADGTVTLGGEISGLSTDNSQIIALLRDDQSLALALPVVAGAPDRVFLSLIPRAVRRAGISP